jgi:competence protein ComEC
MSKRSLYIVVIGGLLLIDLGIGLSIWSAHQQVLTVSFLDVGQGDAILIETPSGVQFLVDGGAGRVVVSDLSAELPFYDRSIDAVLATHADSDHIGGLVDVLNLYQVGYVFSADTAQATAVAEAFETAAVEETPRLVIPHRGEVVSLGDGVTLLVLWPDQDLPSTENEASVVAKLTYGATSFLLTGDAPQSVEKYLVAHDKSLLDSDVLKVGHHGSRTSSAPEFIQAVSPAYAVISAGVDNPYGHPHPETLATLAAAHIETECTCTDGTLIFASDGSNVWRQK